MVKCYPFLLFLCLFETSGLEKSRTKSKENEGVFHNEFKIQLSKFDDLRSSSSKENCKRILKNTEKKISADQELINCLTESMKRNSTCNFSKLKQLDLGKTTASVKNITETRLDITKQFRLREIQKCSSKIQKKFNSLFNRFSQIDYNFLNIGFHSLLEDSVKKYSKSNMYSKEYKVIEEYMTLIVLGGKTSKHECAIQTRCAENAHTIHIYDDQNIIANGTQDLCICVRSFWCGAFSRFDINVCARFKHNVNLAPPCCCLHPFIMKAKKMKCCRMGYIDCYRQDEDKGVLITGGEGVTIEPKVELYHLENKTSCTLPQIPENNGKFGHTSNGGVICGGQATGSLDGATTCLDISSGAWSSSNYQALNFRYTDHVSWNIGIGESFMLLGGGDSFTNTEKVHTNNGSAVVSFTMQFSTM